MPRNPISVSGFQFGRHSKCHIGQQSSASDGLLHKFSRHEHEWLGRHDSLRKRSDACCSSPRMEVQQRADSVDAIEFSAMVVMMAVWEWQLGRIRAVEKVRKRRVWHRRERTYGAYSVRFPCSHKEQYMRPAQMALVNKKVSNGRGKKAYKDGQDSDCMEETKKISAKLSAVIDTNSYPLLQETSVK